MNDQAGKGLLDLPGQEDYGGNTDHFPKWWFNVMTKEFDANVVDDKSFMPTPPNKKKNAEKRRAFMKKMKMLWRAKKLSLRELREKEGISIPTHTIVRHVPEQEHKDGFGIYFPHIMKWVPRDHENFVHIQNFVRVISKNGTWPYKEKEKMVLGACFRLLKDERDPKFCMLKGLYEEKVSLYDDSYEDPDEIAMALRKIAKQPAPPPEEEDLDDLRLLE